MAGGSSCAAPTVHGAKGCAVRGVKHCNMYCLQGCVELPYEEGCGVLQDAGRWGQGSAPHVDDVPKAVAEAGCGGKVGMACMAASHVPACPLYITVFGLGCRCVCTCA